jgi:N-acetylmuramic acid 6-phosphate etherase
MSGSDLQRLDALTTEGVNAASAEIDALEPLEIVRLIQREDRAVLDAVAAAEEEIALAVALVERAFRAGGRLLYIGAGTSGRLGVLDASECPPTFRTPPEMVVGLIAGGDGALRRAIEGAEDDPQLAVADLQAAKVEARDCVMGIATSGRTPYVLGGLAYARQCGARTIGLACNHGSPLQDVCELLITAVVGPEIVSGSTRMKAGTATKLILNTITTSAMIRIGKTYGNLMVDLRATNQKLQARSRRLVRILTGLDESAAAALLKEARDAVKPAAVMHHRQVGVEEAERLLAEAGGVLRAVIGSVRLHSISGSV